MKFKTLASKPGRTKFGWNAFALFVIIAMVLTGCSALGQATPQPLPTVVLDNNSTTQNAASSAPSQANRSGVTASGIVAPAQQAQMASPLGGNVEAVNVAVGD